MKGTPMRRLRLLGSIILLLVLFSTYSATLVNSEDLYLINIPLGLTPSSEMALPVINASLLENTSRVSVKIGSEVFTGDIFAPIRIGGVHVYDGKFEEGGEFTFSKTERGVSGIIRSNAGVFSVNGSDSQTLVTKLSNVGLSNHLSDVIDVSSTPSIKSILPEKTIDILVVYPEELDNVIDVRGFTARQIVTTNLALIHSYSDVKLRLVCVEPLTGYVEPTSMYDYYYDLEQRTSAMRNRCGADIVHGLSSKTNLDVCGLGLLLTQEGLGNDKYASRVFSVSAPTCEDIYAFAHEIGHNLGGNHNKEVMTPSGREIPFSFGYAKPGIHRDIMSYDCPNHCRVVRHFSSPLVVLDGHPLGTTTENVASAFNTSASTASSWVKSKLPLIEAKFDDNKNTIYSPGESVTFSGTLSGQAYVSVLVNWEKSYPVVTQNNSWVVTVPASDLNRSDNYLTVFVDGVPFEFMPQITWSDNSLSLQVDLWLNGSTVVAGEADIELKFANEAGELLYSSLVKNGTPQAFVVSNPVQVTAMFKGCQSIAVYSNFSTSRRLKLRCNIVSVPMVTN